MILASSSCKFGGDNLQLQDIKCSCFNSCKQCASQKLFRWYYKKINVLIHVNNVQVKNYLGGIIKKSL
jgi:hypothetical protein